MLKNITESTDIMRVTNCMNLRPAEGRAELLKAVGAPRIIAPKGWIPLIADGPRLVAYRPDNLSIGWLNPENELRENDPGVSVAATLPAQPLCAFAEGSAITVMTNAGAWQMQWQGKRYDIPGLAPDWPDIALTAVEGTILNTGIPAGTADDLAVTAVDAYRSLAVDFNSLGQFMQPFVARCRLVGKDGHVLHVTPPVCVTPASGSRLNQALHIPLSDGLHNGSSVMATGFELGISLCGDVPDAWRSKVAAIEVFATPQFHCCNMTDKAEVTITQRTGAAGLATTANVFLPGSEHAANGSGLLRAISRFDSLAERIAVIDNPFADSSTGKWTAGAPQVADVVASAKAFRTALGTRCNRHKADDVLLSLPHTFAAAMTAENGGRRIMGGLSRCMWRGYGAGAFAAQFADDKQWQGVVRVVFADGSEHVADIYGKGTPSLVGPMISYPDPSARQLTITVGEAGLTVPLTPDASGCHAVWTNPTGKPVSLGDDFVAVTSSATAKSFEPVDRLLAISVNGEVAATVALPQTPSAILAARASGGAWDFGRSRFYIFGNDGIRLLAVSASATSVNMLSEAAVADAAQVCQAGAAVYLLSAERLLKLENSRLTTLVGEWPYNRIAYCALCNELVLATDDDNEAVSLPLDGGGAYTTPLVIAASAGHSGWLQAVSSLFAATDVGLVDLGRRGNAAVPISWTATMTPKTARAGQRQRTIMVEIPLYTAEADLQITVNRSYMGRSALVKRLHVKGALKSPLLMRLASRPDIAVQIKVEGTARPDSLLGRPSITRC